MPFIKKSLLPLLTLFLFPVLTFSQSEIDLKGTLVDSTDFPIPYGAVSLLKNKNAGAYSTEDGEFLITITEKDFLDTLSISSLGYKTKKLSIKEFMALKDRKIMLEESITSLNQIEVLSPSEYAHRAIKNLKNTTLRKRHQKNALYRVTTTESGKAKKFVEYYVKISDVGPISPDFLEYEFTERRQSADYRMYKKDETLGNFENLLNFNILRNPSQYKKSRWKKIGDTSFDNEDIIILKNASNTKIYVGLNNYGIYKISKGNLLYIYNKDELGKLYLSYHKREWKDNKNIKDPAIISQLKALGQKNPNKLKTSIRYEFITLDIIKDKKKMSRITSMSSGEEDINFKNNDPFSNKKNQAFSKSQNKYSISNKKLKIDNIKYNEAFWKNFQMPPETKFLKKIKDELESLYGVSFEDQLKLSNK